MSPVTPDRKKSRLYATAGESLERMQLAHGLREVLHLWQDVVLEIGRVGDERVGGCDALHGRVQPGEALIGEAGRDFGTVSPRTRVLVRHDDSVRLLDRRCNRVPIDRR